MTGKQKHLALENIIQLRKDLHRNAELSGHEIRTKELIKGFLLSNAPSGKIVETTNNGLLVIFGSNNIGATIMFRADTDALPISENNTFSHASCNNGVSHKCGHDGHSAILCGLACLLHQSPVTNGKITLLFQPAEETGKGAKQMIDDPSFKPLAPDYIFALHNIPGFEKGSIIVKKEQFASASKGMIIRLMGKACHAAYPEQGNNPARAFAEIIQGIERVPDYSESFDNFILTTIVHASLGRPDFGIAAGNALIMATLRSYDNHNMQKLVHECSLIVEEKAKESGLQYTIEWADEFDETFNHPDAVDVIENAATNNNLKVVHLPFPYRWSEDFGQYTRHFKGAMFGLGAGKEQPALHTNEYDFPDDIIETGMNMFSSIIQNILQ
jgi:amidohydrolase